MVAMRWLEISVSSFFPFWVTRLVTRSRVSGATLFESCSFEPATGTSLGFTEDPQKSKKQPKLKKRKSMPHSLPTATPPKVRGKSKGNRSVRCIPGGNEAIWDEELHAALIEGKLF